MTISEIKSIVSKIAALENFQISKLNINLDKYYVTANNSGHRCVDGRKVLEKFSDGSNTGYQNQNYLGFQFPGGTFGILGALRLLSNWDEDMARGLMQSILIKNNIQMGDHIDDGHGEITDKFELLKRTQGCGNQDALAAGKMPMYKGLVDRESVNDRFDWLKENKGSLPVLSGHHEEKMAVINLVSGKTFDTSVAVDDKASVFNLDVMEVERLAKLIFVKNNFGLSETEFISKFIGLVVQDYLQTLKALTKLDTVYLQE